MCSGNSLKYLGLQSVPSQSPLTAPRVSIPLSTLSEICPWLSFPPVPFLGGLIHIQSFYYNASTNDYCTFISSLHPHSQLLLFTFTWTHKQSQLISYKYESSFISKLLFNLISCFGKKKKPKKHKTFPAKPFNSGYSCLYPFPYIPHPISHPALPFDMKLLYITSSHSHSPDPHYFTWHPCL